MPSMTQNQTPKRSSKFVYDADDLVPVPEPKDKPAPKPEDTRRG